MIRVFIGQDSKESVAYAVAAHSVASRCSRSVSLAPVALAHLAHVFTRDRVPHQSTEFSFTRFLVPWMCGYEGWSIFMDCDFLVLEDVAKLWDLRDDRYAVQVVQHDHQPSEQVKFLGNTQTRYPRKNWSSLMLFNNERCKSLTPELVNTAEGLFLHRFHWLAEDELIGALPARWNHLVDYDAPKPLSELSALHFTSGGPWFEAYSSCGYADAWRKEFESMIAPLKPQAA